MKNQGIKILASLIVGLCVSSPNAFAGAATPLAAPADECSNDFKRASTHFQAILGPDAPLDRIPMFPGQFSAGGFNLKTENTIVQSGDQVFLNVKVPMMSINISVPIEVCKKGGQLTASLMMSAAVMKNPKGDVPLQKNFPKIPNAIVMNISRDTKKNVVFKSETYPEQPAVAVTVK